MNFVSKTLEIREGGTFRILGRQRIVDGIPRFSWSNSGIEFNAVFDRMTVYFGEYTADQPVMYKIYVDGYEVKASVMGKGVTAVIENVRDRKHKVKILRISEGTPLTYIDKIVIFGSKPEFSMPEESKQLKLEFLLKKLLSKHRNTDIHLKEKHPFLQYTLFFIFSDLTTK